MRHYVWRVLRRWMCRVHHAGDRLHEEMEAVKWKCQIGIDWIRLFTDWKYAQPQWNRHAVMSARISSLKDIA